MQTQTPSFPWKFLTSVVQCKKVMKCPNLWMKESGSVMMLCSPAPCDGFAGAQSCCWQGRHREFELFRGSLDPSMWKIRTICCQRGQTQGIRKIIPPLSPSRHAANGLQCPGPLQSSPSPSQDIRRWLGSKKGKTEGVLSGR